ncbi:MAG: lysophospholipase L1-like esterase, partial [Verrucomicrobiales bacterium]|nr:lysophospholipase L1-like esterase [Verrucomicrobiales bacterium]
WSADLFDLFVAATVYHLQVPPEFPASCRCDRSHLARRCLVPMVRATLPQRQTPPGVNSNARVSLALAAKLILIFLVLAAALVWAAPVVYERRLERKVWPPAHVAGARLGLTPQLTARTNLLLLVGDSRIWEWGEPVLDRYSILNVGMPGATSAEVLASLPPILEQTRPTAVIIQVGINDLKLLGLRPKSSREIESLVLTNIFQIARLCQTHGAKVIVTPIWPPGEVTLMRRIVWNPAIERGVKAVNHQILRSNLRDFLVMDLYEEAFHDVEADHRFNLYRDTLHLKSSAYEALSKALRRRMRLPAPG